MTAKPLDDFVISDHAHFEMQRRQITEEQVRAVLAAPQQVVDVRSGRQVYQSRITIRTPGKEYLLRIIVDTEQHPAKAVTVYLPSKVEKYWRSKS